jgi:hypothetical protein
MYSVREEYILGVNVSGEQLVAFLGMGQSSRDVLLSITGNNVITLTIPKLHDLFKSPSIPDRCRTYERFCSSHQTLLVRIKPSLRSQGSR